MIVPFSSEARVPANDHSIKGPITQRGLVARGAGLTHRGAVRPENEDAILVDPSGRVWAVADGMGGHMLGGYAAEQVIDALESIPDDGDPAEALAARFAAADAAISARGTAEGALIGATAVAVVIRADEAVLAWAGDARAYLLREGRLSQLTRDHSLVQEMVDAGKVDAEAARGHPQSNVVTRAVGTGGKPDFRLVGLKAGDRLLLCSDGLTNVLPDAALIAVLHATRPGTTIATGTPADAASAMLLRQTLAGGAPDNVSVIVIDITEG